MKILHLEADKYSSQALEKLRTFDFEAFECPDQEALLSHLSTRSYEVIFTRIGLMLGKEEINLQPNLKFIVSSTTGLNHINVDYTLEKGIRIISLKGESEFLETIKSTAEHTWALLMALIRKLEPIRANINRGYWERTQFLADELDQKTIGIIGFGRLGKVIVGYAKAFGMNILINDSQSVNTSGFGNIKAVGIDDLLKVSDYVILLISYQHENENFMDASKFSMMKSGSYFINTSRGEHVDEKALLAHLENGHLAGAGLDVLWNDSVWSPEIQGSESLLHYMREHDNLIITSHTGGFGKESIIKTRDFVTRKFITAIL